jgi:hypothetical protein
VTPGPVYGEDADMSSRRHVASWGAAGVDRAEAEDRPVRLASCPLQEPCPVGFGERVSLGASLGFRLEDHEIRPGVTRPAVPSSPAQRALRQRSGGDRVDNRSADHAQPMSSQAQETVDATALSASTQTSKSMRIEWDIAVT